MAIPANPTYRARTLVRGRLRVSSCGRMRRIGTAGRGLVLVVTCVGRPRPRRFPVAAVRVRPPPRRAAPLLRLPALVRPLGPCPAAPGRVGAGEFANVPAHRRNVGVPAPVLIVATDNVAGMRGGSERARRYPAAAIHPDGAISFLLRIRSLLISRRRWDAARPARWRVRRCARGRPVLRGRAAPTGARHPACAHLLRRTSVPSWSSPTRCRDVRIGAVAAIGRAECRPGSSPATTNSAALLSVIRRTGRQKCARSVLPD